MGIASSRRLHAACAAVLLLAVGQRAAALSTVNQFCTGDPCIISSPKDVDPGAMLDFGTRTVILQSTLNLLALPSGAIGSVTIHAGSFSIIGSNGQITGFSATFSGGSVEIDADNDIQLNSTNGGGAVRLYGQDAGSLTLNTTNGSVTASGRLTMYGNGTYASGGLLTINSGANISLTGQMDFYGGAQGCGGDFELTANGDVTVNGVLDLSGGGDGGCLDVTANGSLTLGQMDMSGTGLDASGGLSEINVGGDVHIVGALRGRGADAGSDCGDGADVDISAGGNITAGADIDMRGRGLDCSGGCLTFDGASVYVPDNILLSGTGSQGDGGELDIYATTLISFTGTLDLSGGDGGGGVAFFSSLRASQVLGSIDASGRASTSPGSTQVEFDATTLTVGGSVNASGGSSTVAGGEIVLNACDVTTQSTAILEALGNLGAINVKASRSATLRGQFAADVTGGNIVRYAPTASVPNTIGGVFVPPVTLILDNTIAPCPVCVSDSDCADGNPCTDDTCNNGASCQHAARTSGSCEDGNLCTTNDTCVAGVCVGGPPPVCVDNNPCTTDTCSPGLGCVFPPAAGSCDDGDPCTTGDACSAGHCVGTPMNCSDGNPCTDDTCSGGICSHAFNHAPCGSGNPCTSQDTCNNGTCVSGPPLDCNDHDICTTDSCNATSGCQHAAIAGCVDTDHDGKIDSIDECTTIAWTAQVMQPPNQNPAKFSAKLTRLAQAGSQGLLMKGVFNVPPSEQLPINPPLNGVHVYTEDASGKLLSVSVPGGTGCAPDDGWSTSGVGFHKTWLYRNHSGALPPGCAPNSANGVQFVQIKDRRLSGPHGLQFKVIAKHSALQHAVAAPLTRLQFDLALAAQPTPGVASDQAKAGQCAEALFTGTPIASAGKPSCEPKTSAAGVNGVSCKGE